MSPGLRCSMERVAATLALCFALWREPAGLSETTPAFAPAPPASTPAENSGLGEDLRLAMLQGKGDSAILDWVLANSGPVKEQIEAGMFRVLYTVTPAEGWWEKAGGGKLAWHEAPVNQVHLRIFVADRSDGRLVPGLSLEATLIDANGNEQALPVAFGWYPLVNAYGGNIPVTDGSYRLRVRIAFPEMREAQPAATGEQLARGEGLARITVAEFPAVTILQNEVMLLPLATETSFAAEAELLKPCNEALNAAITALWRQSTSGEEKSDGNYFVAYALGDTAWATPLARLRRKGMLDFSGKENTRLEVLVRDSRTGRLIPFLAPQARLDADGELYDGGELTPLRHPWLNLYGRNVRLPRKGSYRLRVTLEAPGFHRWGRKSERFALPSQVEFDGVSLRNVSLRQEGQKPEKPKGDKPAGGAAP